MRGGREERVGDSSREDEFGQFVTMHAKAVIKTAVLSMFSLLVTSVPSMAASSPVIASRTPGLSPAEFTRIVAEDIEKRQALVTADFTRSIYSEEATFQDEIDLYKIDDYVRGTKALFIPDCSRVELVDQVSYDEATRTATFNFRETLCFNVPFRPKVKLTGRVELQTTTYEDRRDRVGLVFKSREYWDQTVLRVLSTVRF